MSKLPNGVTVIGDKALYDGKVIYKGAIVDVDVKVLQDVITIMDQCGDDCEGLYEQLLEWYKSDANE